MRPRIVAIDLDGTLLPATKRLTPRAREAVRAVRAAGVEVVLATGKTFHLAAGYAGELGLAGPLIALDGSLVREWPGGETIVSTGIPAGRAREVLARIAAHDLRTFLTDGTDRFLIDAELGSWEGFLSAYSDRATPAAAPGDAAAGDPFFVAALGAYDEVLRGEVALRDFHEDGLRVFTAEFREPGVGLLVVKPRTHKGAALSFVAERLGIPREETAAIGDWRNDVEMIEWAGVGVAMADAHPEVLAVADVVLPDDCESDGVARWLEEILSPNP